jgi:hypothetical protein
MSVLFSHLLLLANVHTPKSLVREFVGVVVVSKAVTGH